MNTWCGLGQNTKGVLSFSPAFGKILRSKTENGFFRAFMRGKTRNEQNREIFLRSFFA